MATSKKTTTAEKTSESKSTSTTSSGNTISINNSNIAIPQHKILKVGNYQMIMDDEYSIKANSKYGALWEASPVNLLSLMSSSFGFPSGQFALQGVQIWQSTDPIIFSCDGNLYMNTDPYTDVVKPALNLTSLCLPEAGDENSGGLTGVIEGLADKYLGLQLKTLIPPGPNLQKILDTMSSNNTGIVSKLAKASYKAGNDNHGRGVVNVTMGFLTITNAIITSVEPTFSKEVSLSTSRNKYYPISAKVSIEFTTMEVGTVQMINGWDY